MFQKILRTTNPQQYEKLIEIMTINKNIWQDPKRSREEVQEFWEEVARVLNSLGPPTKGGIAWRKVWTDWKCYVKRKISINRSEMVSTGGGCCKLQKITPLEETLISLTGLNTTSAIGESDDFGEFDNPNVTPSGRKVTSPRRTGAKKKSRTLQEQKDMKSESCSHNALENKMDEIATNLRHMNSLLEKQLNEQQRHNAAVEEILKKQLEIQMKKC